MTPRGLVRLLSAIEIVGLLPSANFPALVPQFTAAWNLSGAEAGWIIGIQSFAYMLVVPFVLSLTDRIDARRFMLAGCVIGGVAHAGFALFADGFISALPWRALGGVGLALFFMPGLRVLTDRLAKAEQGYAITIYMGCYAAGMGISYAVVGLVEESFGWRAAFLVSAAGPLAVLPAILLFVHPQQPVTGPEGNNRHPLDFRPLFANRPALGFILATAGHTFEFSAMRAWMTAFLVFAMAQHGVPAIYGLSAATIAALTNFVTLPSSMTGASLGRRFGQRRMVFVIMAGSFLLASLTGVIGTWPLWVAVAFVFLHTFTSTADQGLLNAGAVAAAKPGEVGMTMSALAVVTFLTTGLGAIMVGVVFDLMGGRGDPAAWSLGYALAALLPLLGLGALSLLSRPSAPADAHSRTS